MCTDKNLYITYDFLLQKNIYAFLHILQIHINKFATALQHKVRTYKEYHSVCLSSKLGLPQPPLNRRLVCLLPLVLEGEKHWLARKWVKRVPIPTREIHGGTLYM